MTSALMKRTRAPRPRHADHGTFTASCSACRWDAMTPEAQATHRAQQRASQPTGAGHATHATIHRGCPACEWDRMDEGEREARREAGRAAWRRRSPERAAVRDALLAAVRPLPCTDCGQPDGTSPAIDYATERVVAWRCPGCWTAARPRRGRSGAPGAGWPRS